MSFAGGPSRLVTELVEKKRPALLVNVNSTEGWRAGGTSSQCRCVYWPTFYPRPAGHACRGGCQRKADVRHPWWRAAPGWASRVPKSHMLSHSKGNPDGKASLCVCWTAYHLGYVIILCSVAKTFFSNKNELGLRM